jgi:hypothetical protein
MPDHERMGAAKEPAANDLMLREDEPEVKVGLQPVKVRLHECVTLCVECRSHGPWSCQLENFQHALSNSSLA